MARKKVFCVSCRWVTNEPRYIGCNHPEHQKTIVIEDTFYSPGSTSKVPEDARLCNLRNDCAFYEEA